jgi:ribosome-associated heat shock protein Hsp15
MISANRDRERSSPQNTASTDAAHARERLDKWLWAARFYKTRSLAVAAIGAGHVRVAGERAKPAREIKVGDHISVTREGLCWEVAVLALSLRRGPASDAALLYRELDDSRSARELMLAQRRASDAANPLAKGRPTKQMRRSLERLLKKSPRDD